MCDRPVPAPNIPPAHRTWAWGSSAHGSAECAPLTVLPAPAFQVPGVLLAVSTSVSQQPRVSSRGPEVSQRPQGLRCWPHLAPHPCSRLSNVASVCLVSWGPTYDLVFKNAARAVLEYTGSGHSRAVTQTPHRGGGWKRDRFPKPGNHSERVFVAGRRVDEEGTARPEVGKGRGGQ